MKKKILAAFALIVTAGPAGAAPDPIKEMNGSNAAIQCQRLSDRAWATGVKILMINFEGAGQFSRRDTDGVYAYQKMRREGRDLKSLPRRGMWGGLLATGLLYPVVREFGRDIELLIFSNTEQGRFSTRSAAVLCARAWMKRPGRSLVITGHSAGAQSAQNLAVALNRGKIAVDSVFTIDPFFTNGVIRKTSNVRRWENFYQLLPSPLPGTPAASVDEDHNLTGRATHGSITAHPEVHAAVFARLKKLTR